ncbi:MAG: hypothetical protein RLZZ440_2307 [Planctomycetota bacterium]
MKPTSAPPTWKLSGSVARRADATIDLADPAAGLLLQPTGDRVLGLELAAEGLLAPSETWCRADDLIAVYDLEDQRKLRATAMWRRLAGPPVTWEVVVSAATAVLESDPRMAVVCELAGGRVSWGRRTRAGVAWTLLEPGAACPQGAECLLVARAADTVILAVHPDEPPHIDVSSAGDRLRIACQLFAAPLEKGVLLRSRVRAAIATVDAAEQAAVIMADLAVSPPPLTT